MLKQSPYQMHKNHYVRKIVFDSLFVLSIFIFAYTISSYFSFSDQYFAWANAYEDSLDIDELPIALITSFASLLWLSHRRIHESSMLQAQNHALLQRVLEVQEDERKRIARDLHDDLGQYLIAVKAQASSLIADKNVSQETFNMAERIMFTADHAYHAARHMMHSLRPVALDTLGLSAALEHLVETWNNVQKNSIQVASTTQYSLCLVNNIDEFSEHINIAIFRIVQEALTNIAKHANAKHASIHVQYKNNTFILNIVDDGVGFEMNKKTNGYGLLGILERCEALGGELLVKSDIRIGTKITAIIKNH